MNVCVILENELISYFYTNFAKIYTTADCHKFQVRKLVRRKQVKIWGRVESEIWNLAVTTLTSYWWHLLAAIVEDFYRGNWNSRVDCSMQVANSGHNDKKTKTKANKGKLEFRSWLHHRYFTDSLVSNLGQSLFQKMNFQTFFMQVSHHVNMYCVLHNQIFD